ncbi:hypothetical protein [Cytobacillus firmus]
MIINACDVDREGSNIFYSIYQMTGAKNKVINTANTKTLIQDPYTIWFH